jgi:hypothetical protein
MSTEFRDDFEQAGQEKGSWDDRRLSRRRLLAAIGAAGAALAASSALNGRIGEAANERNPNVTGAVYGSGVGSASSLAVNQSNAVLAVTLNELRAELNPNADCLY